MQKILRSLLLVVVASSPFVLLLTLPFHDFALFRQSEPPSVGLHLAAGLAAAVMLLMMAAPSNVRIRPVLPMPALALFGLAAAGVLSSIAGVEPFMGITGSLEHGVGAFWFLEVGVLAVAAATLVSSGARSANVLRWSAATAVSIGIVLQQLKPRSGGVVWSPYDFPEWIGMSGPIAAAVLLTGGRVSKIGGVALMVASILLSDNRATVLVALAAVVFLLLLKARPSTAEGRTIPVAVALLAVAGLAVLTFAKAPLEGFAASRPDVVASVAVPSTNPLDKVAIQNQPYGTIWQRSVNMNIVLEAFADDPSTILTGTGYGSFEQVVSRRGHDAPGRYFEAASETASLTYWDGDLKARFHSHNLLMESILSSGIAGGILWLALLYSIPASARRDTRYAAILLATTLAVGGTFWFVVNTAGPLLAIGAGLVAGPRVSRTRYLRVRSAAVCLLLAFSSIVSLAWSAFSYATIVGEKGERRFLQAAVSLGTEYCSGFDALGMPVGQINTKLYDVLVREVSIRKPGVERDEAMKKWWPNVSAYSCLLRTYSDAGDMAALRKSLELRSRIVELMVPDQTMLKALNKDFYLWPEDLLKLLSSGPGHEDLILPMVAFVESKATVEQTDKVLEIIASTLPEGSPVGSWIRFKKLSRSGDEAGGRLALKQAFERGLANLKPFSAAEVAGALR